MRTISRFAGNAQFWWDDYCNFVAFMLSVAYTTVGLISKSLANLNDPGQQLTESQARDWGGVDHIWFVQFDNITRILQVLYSDFMLYLITRGLTRLSILLFYQRIFRIPSARPWIVGTFWFTIVLTFTFCMVCAFQCTPVPYFWLRWDGEHEGHCLSTGLVVWLCAIFTIVRGCSCR
jgi:hypothetical protein